MVSERSLALSKQRYPNSTNYLLIENDRIPAEPGRFRLGIFGMRVSPHSP